MKRLARHVVPVALIALVTLGLGLVAARVSGHETVAIGTEADRIYVVDGFYDPEQSAEQGVYRWAQPYAILTLPNWGPGNVHVSISGVGGGTAPTEAVLSVGGVPVNTAPVMPGQPWTVQAWGIAAARSPTVTLGGPPSTAPGDARSLGRLVKQLEIYAPDARTWAWLNLALLALGGALLYTALLKWTGRAGLALICGVAVPAVFGPLAVYRDPWTGVVAWALPITLSVLLALDRLLGGRRKALRPRWSTLLYVLALTFGLLLLAQGFMNAFDSDRMYQLSAGLAEYGLPTRYPGHDTWTKYGFGQPLIAVPFYLLGKLGTLFGGDYDKLTRFTVSLTNLVVLAVTCWLLYRAARRFARPGVALMVIASFLLATPALNYGRTFFSEPGGAMLLLAATLLLVPHAGRAEPSAGRVIAAGALLGAIIIFKPAFAIHIVPAGLAVLWMAWMGVGGPGSEVAGPAEPAPDPRPPALVSQRARHALGRGLLFSIGPLLGLGVQLAYNYLRYEGLPNAWLRTGYEKEAGFSTPLFEGLGGILFSPGKSLFLYAPVLVLAPVGLWLMFRRGDLPGSVAATLIAVQAAASLVFNAMWWAWTGNFAWGPRLVMTVLPLLVWPLAPLGEYIAAALPSKPWYAAAKILAAAWLALGVTGVLISIPGALTDFQVYFRLHGLLLAEDALGGPTVYSLSESPLFVQPGYLVNGMTAAIHRPALSDVGLPPAWDIVIPAALVVLACLCLWGASTPTSVGQASRERPPAGQAAG